MSEVPSRPVIQKTEYIRSKRYTDLAEGMDCQIATEDCKGETDTVVACHANSQMWGKGWGIKAHDIMTVHGCRPCHQRLDGGPGSSDAKEEMFWVAWYATIGVAARSGWIKTDEGANSYIARMITEQDFESLGFNDAGRSIAKRLIEDINKGALRLIGYNQ